MEKQEIINASQIDNNFLVNAFISEFDEEFNLKRNIQSEKINIKKKEMEIYNPRIFEDNTTKNPI